MSQSNHKLSGSRAQRRNQRKAAQNKDEYDDDGDADQQQVPVETKDDHYTEETLDQFLRQLKLQSTAKQTPSITQNITQNTTTTTQNITTASDGDEHHHDHRHHHREQHQPHPHHLQHQHQHHHQHHHQFPPGKGSSESGIDGDDESDGDGDGDDDEEEDGFEVKPKVTPASIKGSPIIYLKGDATKPSVAGHKILAHVCNDIGGWGKGFVVAISDRWQKPEDEYRAWFKRNDGTFQLGNIQMVDVQSDMSVANMIGQHGIATKKQPDLIPVRYDAITKCLQQLAVEAIKRKSSVHMPRIGCGLAGGEWSVVEPIIISTLCANNIPVYVYDFDAPPDDGRKNNRQRGGGRGSGTGPSGIRRNNTHHANKHNQRRT